MRKPCPNQEDLQRLVNFIGPNLVGAVCNVRIGIKPYLLSKEGVRLKTRLNAGVVYADHPGSCNLIFVTKELVETRPHGEIIAVILHEYQHINVFNPEANPTTRKEHYNREFDADMLAVELGFGKDLAHLLNVAKGFDAKRIAKRQSRHPSVLARVGRILSLIEPEEFYV